MYSRIHSNTFWVANVKSYFDLTKYKYNSERINYKTSIIF